MEDILERNWLAVAARGVVAFLFGVLTVAWPGLTIAMLIIAFSIYAIADGLFSIVSATRASEQQERWWPMAFGGVVSVSLGLLTLAAPARMATLFVIILAVWAIMTGVIELVALAPQHRRAHGEWLLAVSDVLKILFGALLLARPQLGLLVVARLIAVYAMISGILLFALSFRLKQHLSADRTGRGIAPHPV